MWLKPAEKMNRFYSASSFFVLSKAKPVLFLVQLAPVRIYVRFVMSYWQKPVQNTNRCAFRPRFNRLGGGASPPVQKHDSLTVYRLHFNTDLGPNRPKTGLIISLRNVWRVLFFSSLFTQISPNCDSSTCMLNKLEIERTN